MKIPDKEIIGVSDSNLCCMWSHFYSKYFQIFRKKNSIKKSGKIGKIILSENE